MVFFTLKKSDKPHSHSRLSVGLGCWGPRRGGPFPRSCGLGEELPLATPRTPQTLTPFCEVRVLSRVWCTPSRSYEACRTRTGWGRGEQGGERTGGQGAGRTETEAGGQDGLRREEGPCRRLECLDESYVRRSRWTQKPPWS